MYPEIWTWLFFFYKNILFSKKLQTSISSILFQIATLEYEVKVNKR